jgi:sarcosine oxidase, subunit gamma
MATNSKILITDASGLPRFGVKGGEAASWLSSQGMTLPATANSWVIDKDSNLILRLGNSEYLVEDQKQGQPTSLLQAASKTRMAGIYPVARADASFMLTGEAVPDLLSEICMLNLDQEAHPQALYMTQIAGISATLLQQELDGVAVVRLWCDGTYHHYMLETLSTIAREIGTLELGLV